MIAKQIKLTSLVAATLITSTLSAHALTLGPIPFTLGSNVLGSTPTFGGNFGTNNYLRAVSDFTEQRVSPWSLLSSGNLVPRFSSYNFLGVAGWVIDDIYVVSSNMDTVLSFWDAGLSQPFINFTTSPGVTWQANGSVGGIILNDDHGNPIPFGSPAQTSFNSALYGAPTFPFTVQENHAYSILVTRWSGNTVFSGNLFIDYHLVPIPEPSTYALALGGGVLGVSFFMRQRKKQLV